MANHLFTPDGRCTLVGGKEDSGITHLLCEEAARLVREGYPVMEIKLLLLKSASFAGTMTALRTFSGDIQRKE